MDLFSHFRIMWRRKWQIVVGALLVAVIVFGFEHLEPKVYQATAQLGVVVGQDIANNSGTSQTDTLFLADTYANLADTVPVVRDSIKRSGLHIDQDTASGRLSVQASTTVGVVTVAANGPSTISATALANGMVSALVNAVTTSQQQQRTAQLTPALVQLQQLEQQLAAMSASDPSRANLQTEITALQQSITNEEVIPLNSVSIIAPASAGSAPVAPKPKTTAILAFVTALVVLAELMVVMEIVSDRFSTVLGDDDIRQVTGLPVLAHIPEGGGPETTEAFRTLRTSLLFMVAAEEVRTIAVVSPDPGAGKSFVSLHLARSASESGVATVVIDGDLRRPVIDRELRLPRAPGLSDVLLGADISTAMHRVSNDNGLLAIPAGPAVPDPAGLLGSHLQGRVLRPLEGARVVVMDTPASDLFPDAATISSQCDATILVIDAKSTKRRTVRTMLDRLRQVQVIPLGVVVNRAKEVPRGTEYYRRAEEESGSATA